MAKSPLRLAHDLRTVNGEIRGSAEHALTMLDPDDPASAEIVRIVRSCEAAVALTTELHTLALASSGDT
jgi:hypothetical protein